MHLAVDVRRAAERFPTRIDWLDAKHSFSFGHHYDPAHTSHGVLLVTTTTAYAPAPALRPIRTGT